LINVDYLCSVQVAVRWSNKANLSYAAAVSDEKRV
jgi:hypothetical protein